MNSLTLELGIAPDVTTDGSLIYLCYGALDGRLMFESFDAVLTRVKPAQIVEPTGCSHAYPRMQWPWLVYRGPGGAADSYAILRDLRSGQARTLGCPVGGNAPVGLGAGYVAYRSVSLQSTFIERLDGLGGVQLLPTPEQYSDGLSRILPGPVPVYVAHDRFSVPGMTMPAFAGDLTVGELPNGGILARLVDGRELCLFEGQETREPRCAVLDAERFVVCCWGQPGVRLAVVNRAEFGIAPPSPEPVPPVAPLHPLWFSSFFIRSKRYGNSLHLPHNCEIIAEPEPGLIRESVGPIVIIPELIVQASLQWSRVIAIYVDAEVEGTLAALDRAASQVRAEMAVSGLAERPVWGYWPRKLQQQGQPQRCIPAVEAYIYPDETHASFYRRMFTETELISHRPWVLISQTYDRNGVTDDATLRAIQPLWPELARDPNCHAVLSFSA